LIFVTPSNSGPRLCPHCGLLVSSDAMSCQCGYVFASGEEQASAASRVRDAVDLFSAREALSIAFQAISELKGGLVLWMAVVGVLQLLPMALVGPKPQTPREVGTLAVCALLSSWVSYGLARTALAGIRGEGVSFRRAFVSPKTFGSILLALFVTIVPVMIGLILFVAPGVYLMLTWSQIGFLILDGRARHVDALRASESLTRDRRLEIFLAMAVPIVLQLPAQLLEAAVPSGGSILSPGFVLFLVSALWQMLLITYGTWVGATIYQMLLNSKEKMVGR
jgi:hypothetical protein